LIDLKANGCEIYPGWYHASEKVDGTPLWGTPTPGAFDIASRPVLNFSVADDGEVLFDYLVDGESVPVFPEFPGAIYLSGDRFLYRLMDHEVLIGRISGHTVHLCSGPFSSVCQLSFGTVGGSAGLDPQVSGAMDAGRPVFTAA